jgi:copper chaperone CopZ
MQQKTVKIDKMSCEHCVRTIESELKGIAGVHSAKAQLNTKSLFIEWDNPATWDEINSTLAEINYPPSE